MRHFITERNAVKPGIIKSVCTCGEVFELPAKEVDAAVMTHLGLPWNCSLTITPNLWGCHDPQCGDSTWDHDCPVGPCDVPEHRRAVRHPDDTGTTHAQGEVTMPDLTHALYRATTDARCDLTGEELNALGLAADVLSDRPNLIARWAEVLDSAAQDHEAAAAEMHCEAGPLQTEPDEPF